MLFWKNSSLSVNLKGYKSAILEKKELLHQLFCKTVWFVLKFLEQLSLQSDSSGYWCKQYILFGLLLNSKLLNKAMILYFLLLTSSRFLNMFRNQSLQWLTEYLRLTLVFVWDSAPREEFNYDFSGIFF